MDELTGSHGPCAGHRLPAEELRGAADKVRLASGSTETSDYVYELATVPGRRLADPFRADNRAGLSGA